MRDQGCQTEDNSMKENSLQFPPVSASIAENRECAREDSGSQSPVGSTSPLSLKAKAEKDVCQHKEESSEEREQEWTTSATVSSKPLRLRFDPSVPPKGMFILLEDPRDKEHHSEQKSQEAVQKCSNATGLSYHMCRPSMPASLLDLIAEVSMLVFTYTSKSLCLSPRLNSFQKSEAKTICLMLRGRQRQLIGQKNLKYCNRYYLTLFSEQWRSTRGRSLLSRT